MLKDVGFQHTELMLQRSNRRLPVGPVMVLESAVGALPAGLSHKLAVSRAMRGVLGVRIVAKK